MAWTEDQKAQLVKDYLALNPTADNSTELVKDLADKYEQSANGVRMVLIQAKVYVKKDTTATDKPAAKGDKPAAKRVSKEDSINALKKLIEDKGLDVDDEILDKLTGKAAVYFASILAG